MKFTATLIAIAAVRGTAAFYVPEGTPDGLYMAYINTDGVEVHEPINSTDALATLDRRLIMPGTKDPETRLAARQPGEIWCGCDYVLIKPRCDDATHELENKLGDKGTTIPSGGALFSVRREVVAFACNPTPIDVTWVHNNAAVAFTKVTERCGWYVAGTYDDLIQAGYMETGGDICERATSSNQHSC